MDNPTARPPQKTNQSIGCFRGSLSLPPFESLIKKFQLNKKTRIQQRYTPLYPAHLHQAERKIERVLRSKSHLDSLFELVPHHPWRQTTTLWAQADSTQTILELDFKNFHPFLLTTLQFAHPAKLFHSKNQNLQNLQSHTGMTRCLLYPKNQQSPHLDTLKNLHPFQIQSQKKSCPFQLETRPIETLLHIAELPIYLNYYEINPLESILCEESIHHPNKNQVEEILKKIHNLETDLQESRLQENSNTLELQKEIKTLKKQANSLCTTPKIHSSKNLPSPYNVHCLSSQIQAMARSLLFETLHHCLNIDPTSQILRVNTDGFQILTNKTSPLIPTLQTLHLIGNTPGKLQIKSQCQESFLLSANFWWNILPNKTLQGPLLQHPPKPPIPLKIHIPNRKALPLIHLADYHHTLDPTTLKKEKFQLPRKLNALTPYLLTQNEKTKSLPKTLNQLRSFRKKTEKTPCAL
jgi:hypothetical protein